MLGGAVFSLGMGIGSCCETARGCPGPYTLPVSPCGIILTTRNEEERDVAKRPPTSAQIEGPGGMAGL